MENTQKVESNGVRSKKTSRNVEINEYFMIFGVILIIAYFLIISRIEGPYIQSYYETESTNSSRSSTTIMLPIWIIFIYFGSGAMLLGFILKFISMIKNPHQQRDNLAYLGVIMTSGNMLVMTYFTLSWFKGVFISILDFIGVIFFILTVSMSVIYLMVHWLKKPVNNREVF